MYLNVFYSYKYLYLLRNRQNCNLPSIFPSRKEYSRMCQPRQWLEDTFIFMYRNSICGKFLSKKTKLVYPMLRSIGEKEFS